MKKLENFIKNTFKNADKENREEIIQRAIESLSEKVEDLIESGLTENEAIDKTVLEFGNGDDYFELIEKKQKKERRLKTIRHYRNDLLFSTVAATLIIGALIFINLVYADVVIWFVVPALAVLFWPLAVLYNLLNKKENRRDTDE
jgi:magnesium-transporting ATPase (P-type)